MWHIFKSVWAILSELQPLFVRQYLVVILTMFSSLFTCPTMFFHCLGPPLPLFFFSYLGHFDHVALTFQVFFTFDVSDHVFSLFWPSDTTFYIFLTLVILTMLRSLFRLFHNAIRCLSTSATMWHIFKSVREILSELKPLFVRQYLVVILSMFSSLFTCPTMFFHCLGPLLPLFIIFLPWSFWPCCTHFSGFLNFFRVWPWFFTFQVFFLRVWPCFFTSLALCYHFLSFSYLGHFDHVALTFQVFFTFDVSDHVFSLFWPSATTFYIFLTLVILTILHSLFRFSSLLTCLTMFFHCFGPPLPLFIFFLPWSFWPCCTHFSGFLHFLRVWPCFFTVLALCYHFLYFSYRGHFDHVALTFQVFFTFYVSDHVFSLFWPSATNFYISLTLVILIMLRSLFRLFHNAIRCLSTSATMWHIFKSVWAILSELQPLFVRQYLVVILTMFSSLFTCPTMFFHCLGPLLPLFIIFLPLVNLTMLHSLFRFSSLLTCLTMFFHCFEHLSYHCFIFFLVCVSNIKPMLQHTFQVFFTTWRSLTKFFHFSGFLHFLRVWPCFFTVLALCYHFLSFSYLGYFDHVALTFQVFFTFDVSDHVFSLFWPSDTTFYIFLTLVILTMLRSLFRLSSLLQSDALSTSATMWHIFKSVREILSESKAMFFHCFGST